MSRLLGSIAGRAVLLSTALSGVAHAATPVVHRSHAHSRAHQAASAGKADGAKSPSPVRGIEARGRADEVSVSTGRLHVTVGGGLMRRVDEARNIQYVGQDYIAKQAPTQNVVNLLTMMPSVNAMPTDAAGINSSGLQVRGLTSNDMGWLMDGAPVLSPGAGNYQAEVLDTENMEQLAIAPGSSSTDDPVTSSLAGTIYMKMRDPAAKAGAQVDFSYGSFNTFRGFFRGDTGEIGHSGVRAFASVSSATEQNWYGPGIQKKIHSDAKILKEFSNGSSIAFEQDFNLSDSGYYYYPTAQQWRQTRWISPDATYSGVNDSSYYKLNNAAPFYSGTVLMPMKFVLSDSLTLTDTPYFWYGYGWSMGGNTVQQGSTYLGNQNADVNLAQGTGAGSVANGTGVLVDNASYGLTYIGGNNLKLNWHTRHNDLYVGYWYENYNLSEKDPVGIVNQATGSPYDITQRANQYTLSNGQKYYSANYFLQYQLNALYVGDSLKLFHDKLNINAGFKDVMITRTADNYLPGATGHQGISENVPLPTLSARYSFDQSNQIFILGEGDYRQPYMGSNLDAYGIGTGQLVNGSSMPKSEYAIKEEFGYRYNGTKFIASVVFYNMNIVNRLLTLNTYQNGVQVSRTENAGGQTSRGVDMQFATAPIWGRFTPYVTFAYLAARQDNNTATTAADGTVDYLRTAGKTQVMSPHYQAALGLTYDDGHFFGNLNVKYISSQYSTLMDDEKMPGYVTDSLTLGYRSKDIGFMKAPKIQVALNNISGSTQRIGVYGYSDNARTTQGVFGGTVNGSSPTYYIDPGFAAIMSVSVGL
ncbi:TonB-dependent receptor [Acetobacter fallax]|uniref:TonB-dependent receptor plug domain-containing protein n=1 Tax=Acetobacter fallax TaxID=1737473 RepID=A0ABX0K7I9_9PROT|nr:TonB-dependent receptor [Acetobacter fallax]NHO31439.1 TonB-dependent receptor plug domain-containing protein [Acetobacter fallax]NHO34977.1 TonB-dependent receptor plug domain-containing protein [Acetobacter fallax]